MAILLCEVCEEQMFSHNSGFFQTYVGYISPPGHNHDDNCQERGYSCENGHTRMVSVIRKCPLCDWRGKTECNTCRSGKKFEEWPEE